MAPGIVPHQDRRACPSEGRGKRRAEKSQSDAVGDLSVAHSLIWARVPDRHIVTDGALYR